jgi:hypothetical protein
MMKFFAIPISLGRKRKEINITSPTVRTEGGTNFSTHVKNEDNLRPLIYRILNATHSIFMSMILETETGSKYWLRN